MSAGRVTPEAATRNAAACRMTLALRVAERDGGLASAGVAIEGYQTAIAAFLDHRVGPHAAYEAVQRTCDRIAARLIEQPTDPRRTVP